MSPETSDPGGTQIPPPYAVPPDVVSVAKAAFRPPDGRELATLVFDSLVDEDAPREDHRLRFEHPHITIDLRVSAHEDESHVHGDVTQPEEGEAVLHIREADVALVSSVQAGEFEFGPLPHGLVRISVTPTHANGTIETVWTDWFRI